jgi:diadenosine tetraphosphatase ApaH/serine/threonine PP2A family protein phosphatase
MQPMLVGIIADLHANLEATLAVFSKLDAIGPEKVVCLGDLAGYNANPNEVIDIVRERRIPTVMGNHDAVVCGLDDPWFFNKTARKAAEWHIECIRDDNKRWLSTAHEQLLLDEGFLAVHGSPGNRDDYILDWLDAMRQIQFLDHSGVNVCFFGHSHRSSFFAEKGHAPAAGMSNGYSIGLQNRYLINPGSVGQPRDKDPRAAFGLYDTDVRSFEFHRVEYDVEAAAQKILQAGLPAELARRLAKGK